MPRKSQSSSSFRKGDPIYISGQQGGWNKSSGRWHSADGRITTRSKAIQSTGKINPENFGGISYKFPTPISDKLSEFESSTSGFQIVVRPVAGKSQTPQATGLSNILQAALDFAPRPKDQPPANYMPPQVQTKMLLSRYFYSTEGDAFNVVAIPIELLSRNIDVQCEDDAMRKDIEEWVEEHRLGEIGGEIWRSMRLYGVGLPLEVRDDNDELLDVVPLPPLSTHIGRYWNSMIITPDIAGEKEWSRELMESFFPPAMFRTLIRHWNDIPTTQAGQGVPLSGDTLKPISDSPLRWEKYSMPMLSRGFRELTTRTIYEDAVRAIIEGFKSQLWVFTLGDAEHPPLPEEINALKNVLGGMAGERTGTLVWRNSPFKVEVVVPQGIDTAVGNAYAGNLTRAFFRKMGITSTVMSGESPGILGATSSGRGSTGDTDVSIYLERCRYQAAQITNWMTYLVKKWLDSKNGKYAQKYIAKTKLVFAPTQLELEAMIAKVWNPLYENGSLSHRTLMNKASQDADVEIANKKEEAKYKELLIPPVSYVQEVVGPAGMAKTTSQTKPQGAPKKTDVAKTKLPPVTAEDEEDDEL